MIYNPNEIPEMPEELLEGNSIENIANWIMANVGKQINDDFEAKRHLLVPRKCTIPKSFTPPQTGSSSPRW